MIERNTALPATASFVLSTLRDNETHLELNLFQGEDGQAIGNEYIGTVTLDGLPPGPKGLVQVVVHVKLDAECVLQVEAKELRSRAAVKATLENRYTGEQLRERLGVAGAASGSQGARAKELEKRSGRFWGFLKRVVGKTAA
jgi:molecular chaperone DnaK (HSP70)